MTASRENERGGRQRGCLVSVPVVMIEELATLAQLVERLIRNQQVASSILAGGSIESIR